MASELCTRGDGRVLAETGLRALADLKACVAVARTRTAALPPPG
jgi:hypothetical protein